MSAVFLRSALSLAKTRVFPVAATLKVASTTRNALLTQHQRFYSAKKENNNNNNQYQSSILNEDLLAKAGMETEDPNNKSAEKKTDSTEKSSEGFPDGEEHHDEFTRTKKRRNNTKSSLDKKKERMSKLFYFSMFGASLAGAGYCCRDWDPVEEPELYNEAENGYSVGKIITRFRKRVIGVSDVFSEPAFTDLLPPPPPEPYRHALTLVLELDDLLVHSEWDHKKGWRTAKRPGLDYFLGYLSMYYEIVIFSKSSMAFAEQTVAKLDPYHAYISYSLFREVCRSKDGKIVKDLSLMNRDLSKLVLIDPNEDSYSMQPDNAIPIDKWEGGKDDRLIKLIPFLESLATSSVKDVRQVLNGFKDKKHIPEEFLEREKKMREQWEKEQSVSSHSGQGLSRMLGMANLKSRKMPIDRVRELGQQNYLNMRTYLKENGEKLLKEEQEKTKEMMAEQNLTVGKIVSEGLPTAEGIAKQQAAAAAKEAEKQGKV